MSDRAADIRIRPTLDVSQPARPARWTRHAPVWWGNTLLILIETTTLVLLLAAYFYIRRNFHEWPPPQGGRRPADPRPAARLAVGDARTSSSWSCGCLPMIWTDLAARRKQTEQASASG